MVRTQVQLTEEQVRLLRQLALNRNVSVAELIRQSVDTLLGQPGVQEGEEIRRRARAVSGRFHSGVRDLSTKHDKYFAESAEK